WLLQNGRTFPDGAVRVQSTGAHGPARDLEQRLPGRRNSCGAPIRAVLEAVSGLFAAVDDGEQWQARHAGGLRSALPDRSDLLGRARDQRPALVLSTGSPGNQADPL